jgi:hypothetical protein
VKRLTKGMLEKGRNPPQSASPPAPSGASPLPYGRRHSDVESAHIKGWVALADAALDDEANQSKKDEANQSKKEGLVGNKTSGRTNTPRVFEVFFGPKRRRSTGNRAFRDNLLI